MGHPSYHGPVRTLGQALIADMPVQLVCGECRHIRQLHAFRLVQQVGGKADGRNLPLSTRIENLFFCRRCGKRVPTIIVAPLDSV